MYKLDFKNISLSYGKKTVKIKNPTKYQLVGAGSQSAVFKLSKYKCVKIYLDEMLAKAEVKALKRVQHLPFIPKLYDSGSKYVVMEYFDGPNLKKYLKNATYVTDSITTKLLKILGELKKANLSMVDVSLRHILVVGNEELKVVNFDHSFEHHHPIPLTLLNDFNSILLKDSFLSQVKSFEPTTSAEWEAYFNQNAFDFTKISVASGGSGLAVITDSSTSTSLIGKGHQGAVYRISEDRCVKIYGRTTHALLEQQVLLNNQHLSFIPKVFETGPNYTVMEYVVGPNLNMYLKKQSTLPEEITKQLLDILTAMKKAGFKQIDAPLRHIFITKDGFKFVDHVYSYKNEQARPLELFKNMYDLNFLDTFLKQVKKLNKNTYYEWKKHPIPIDGKKNGVAFKSIKSDKSVKADYKSKHHKKGKHRKR